MFKDRSHSLTWIDAGNTLPTIRPLTPEKPKCIPLMQPIGDMKPYGGPFVGWCNEGCHKRVPNWHTVRRTEKHLTGLTGNAVKGYIQDGAAPTLFS